MTKNKSLLGFRSLSSLFLLVVVLVSSSLAFAAGTGTGANTGTASSTAPSKSSGSAAMPSIVPHDDSTTYEQWKGPTDQKTWNFSAMTGLGIVNATPGVALMGAAAKRIVDKGFAPDINDSVWVEVELGPVFAKGGAGLVYSGHLRWDFIKNESWGFYGLGGFGGANTSEALGNKFEFYPRFAAGALWKIFVGFTLRAEVSHELTVVGAQFEL